MNLVFDTQRGRLAYAWSGNFLDMSSVWVNRGGNQAKILGQKFLTAPAGQPWAITSGKTPPDYAALLDDPAYGANMPEGKVYLGPKAVKFEGYSLDTGGTPTFKYSVTPDAGKTTLGIQETPQPARVTVANGVTRKFALDLPAGKTAWFYAAEAKSEPRALGANGAKLTPQGNDLPSVPVGGTRLVVPEGDRALVVAASGAPEGATWVFVKQKSGGTQILLRLPEAAAASKVEVILNFWMLPKDDDKLIDGLK